MGKKILLAAYGPAWDFTAMKGVVEQLAEAAGIPALRAERNAEGTSYHPGRAADLYAGKTKIGTVGEVHPAVCTGYGIKARVVAADLDLDALFACRGACPQCVPLPRHPATTRDLALVADEAVPAAALEGCIREGAGQLLERVSLFDIYTGDKLGAGKKSLAYSLVFRAADRTLTDVWPKLPARRSKPTSGMRRRSPDAWLTISTDPSIFLTKKMIPSRSTSVCVTM